MVIANNTVSLQEVLPFSPTQQRAILVCDSVECKGDFVVKTMVTSVLNTTTNSNNVLYISGDVSVSEAPLTAQLKRMGCDVLRGQGRLTAAAAAATKSKRLTIRNLVTEMADKILLLQGEKKSVNDADDIFDSTLFLKQVYRDIKEWISSRQQQQQSPQQQQSSAALSWIVLDDVSGMATVLGEKVVYQFVDSLLALQSNRRNSDDNNENYNFGLIVRCSSDLDQMMYKETQNEANRQYTGWIGAGGLAHQQALQSALQTTAISILERSLPRKVDAIVDVLPLPSGFSRDGAWPAHLFRNTTGARMG